MSQTSPAAEAALSDTSMTVGPEADGDGGAISKAGSLDWGFLVKAAITLFLMFGFGHLPPVGPLQPWACSSSASSSACFSPGYASASCGRASWPS